MSFLRSAKTSATVTPDYTGLQLQTSASTLAVPIVWGRSKIAANVLWYQNFQAVPQYSKSGGKGGGSGRTLTGYSYTADLIMGLVEGPIGGVGTVWRDESIDTLASLGLTLFNGATPQAVWGYLSAANPSQALAYQGTAYVCAASYALGDEADIGNHNFEVYGVFAGGGINGVDADPAQCVSDFLTNPQYGVGFDGASIAASTLFGASGDSSLQTYCRAMGVAFSPALVDQEQASSILTRWLQILNCAAVWSGGQLKFIPYGDSSITGNGYTFNPDLTPVYALADDDFVDAKSNDDPVLVSRVDPFSLPTIQRIEVMARANQYGLQTVEARDQSQIELFGPLVGSTITAHEICDPTVVGATVAQTILQRALYVRASFTFKLSWEYCLLDPMDIVEITDANLGLSACPVRILAIEEDDHGVLTVAAQELTSGVSTPALYPTAIPAGASLNQSVAADSVNAPLIFEPPASLTGGAAQIWVGASGGSAGAADPNWGGAYVWVSLDDLTYTQVATVAQPLRQGVLATSLPAASGWDLADAPSVDMAMSAGQLEGTTQASAQQGATLSLVDGELLAYQAASLTNANVYTLSGLQRAMYASAATAHAIGAPFARLDAAVVKYDLAPAQLGATLYFKFQSFNVFGGGVQSLAECAAYPFTNRGIGSQFPVADQLASGLPVDLGAVGSSWALSDDFGALTGAVLGALNLGDAQ